MAVAFHSESIEIQDEDDEEDEDIKYENVETKTTAQQKHPQKIRSVRRRYRLVGMGLGLLCVVQALLNIGLRLSLFSNSSLVPSLVKDLDHLQSRYNNITAERDELKRRLLCESPGWQKFGRGCYYISTYGKTWEQSRQYCRDKQSDLIIIKSKEEQDFVNSDVNKYLNVWLGLTDREEEGVWKWVDGTTLTTPTYWHSGEPSNSTKENCAVYHYGARKGWLVVSCTTTLNWICEIVL